MMLTSRKIAYLCGLSWVSARQGIIQDSERAVEPYAADRTAGGIIDRRDSDANLRIARGCLGAILCGVVPVDRVTDGPRL